jgi:hypothetical protein
MKFSWKVGSLINAAKKESYVFDSPVLRKNHSVRKKRVLYMNEDRKNGKRRERSTENERRQKVVHTNKDVHKT